VSCVGACLSLEPKSSCKSIFFSKRDSALDSLVARRYYQSSVEYRYHRSYHYTMSDAAMQSEATPTVAAATAASSSAPPAAAAAADGAADGAGGEEGGASEPLNPNRVKVKKW
ncbi:MAG: hypothetical protein Q7T57_09320, partial [Dehalococcoidales bacterium]|nr:hypothetical protein [Dehalococcoidales bacterium]